MITKNKSKAFKLYLSTSLLIIIFFLRLLILNSEFEHHKMYPVEENIRIVKDLEYNFNFSVHFDSRYFLEIQFPDEFFDDSLLTFFCDSSGLAQQNDSCLYIYWEISNNGDIIRHFDSFEKIYMPIFGNDSLLSLGYFDLLKKNEYNLKVTSNKTDAYLSSLNPTIVVNISGAKYKDMLIMFQIEMYIYLLISSILLFTCLIVFLRKYFFNKNRIE